jgi:hypothetical protein
MGVREFLRRAFRRPGKDEPAAGDAGGFVFLDPEAAPRGRDEGLPEAELSEEERRAALERLSRRLKEE